MILLFILNFVFAQTSAPLSVVQFEKGTIKRGEKTITFPDVIYEGETLTVGKDSYVKLKHVNECISVHYAGSSVQILKDKFISKGTSRWICEDKTRVEDGTNYVEFDDGEILVEGNDLFIIKGKGEGSGFSNKEANDEMVEKLNAKYPTPEEGYKPKQPDPEKVYSSRFFIMVSPFGTGGLDHDNSAYDAGDLRTFGARLGTHQRIFGLDTMLFFGHIEGENSENNEFQNGPPPVGYNGTDYDGFVAGIGLRHKNFQDHSSLYYYLGYQDINSHISRRTDTFDYFARLRSSMVIGGIGYDKIFWSKNKFALYTSIELMLGQSIGSAQIYQDHNNTMFPQPRPAANKGIRTYALFLNLGPVIQF